MDAINPTHILVVLTVVAVVYAVWAMYLISRDSRRADGKGPKGRRTASQSEERKPVADVMGKSKPVFDRGVSVPQSTVAADTEPDTKKANTFAPENVPAHPRQIAPDELDDVFGKPPQGETNEPLDVEQPLYVEPPFPEEYADDDSLPTRLLDLTTNPLIALYFAVSEFSNRHGEVVVFKIPKNNVKYYDSDTVSVLANLSKCDGDFECDDSLPKEEFNKSEHISLLLHQIGFEKPHFQRIIEPQDVNRVLCVKVKQNNPRIVNQSVTFLLFGVNKKKSVKAEVDPAWLPLEETNKLLIYKKKEIRKDLELLGITTSFVYPEMETYARKLKEIYQ